MPQTVTIHNGGTVGATIYGQRGFGEWESVPLGRQMLPEVIRRRAAGLIREARTIKLEPPSIPVVEGTRIEYRQQLGPVTTTEDHCDVLVNVEFEIKDVATNATLSGVARLLCH